MNRYLSLGPMPSLSLAFWGRILGGMPLWLLIKVVQEESLVDLVVRASKKFPFDATD